MEYNKYQKEFLNLKNDKNFENYIDFFQKKFTCLFNENFIDFYFYNYVDFEIFFKIIKNNNELLNINKILNIDKKLLFFLINEIENFYNKELDNKTIKELKKINELIKFYLKINNILLIKIFQNDTLKKYKLEVLLNYEHFIDRIILLEKNIKSNNLKNNIFEYFPLLILHVFYFYLNSEKNNINVNKFFFRFLIKNILKVNLNNIFLKFNLNTDLAVKIILYYLFLLEYYGNNFNTYNIDNLADKEKKELIKNIFTIIKNINDLFFFIKKDIFYSDFEFDNINKHLFLSKFDLKNTEKILKQISSNIDINKKEVEILLSNINTSLKNIFNTSLIYNMAFIYNYYIVKILEKFEKYNIFIKDYELLSIKNIFNVYNKYIEFNDKNNNLFNFNYVYYLSNSLKVINLINNYQFYKFLLNQMLVNIEEGNYNNLNDNIQYLERSFFLSKNEIILILSIYDVKLEDILEIFKDFDKIFENDEDKIKLLKYSDSKNNKILFFFVKKLIKNPFLFNKVMEILKNKGINNINYNLIKDG